MLMPLMYLIPFRRISLVVVALCGVLERTGVLKDQSFLSLRTHKCHC